MFRVLTAFSICLLYSFSCLDLMTKSVLFLCHQQATAVSSVAEPSNVDSEQFKVSFEGKVSQIVRGKISVCWPSHNCFFQYQELLQMHIII